MQVEQRLQIRSWCMYQSPQHQRYSAEVVPDIVPPGSSGQSKVGPDHASLSQVHHKWQTDLCVGCDIDSIEHGSRLEYFARCRIGAGHPASEAFWKIAVG